MPYSYPREFPPRSIAVVAAEELRSGRAFEEAKREANRISEVEDLFRTHILQVLIVFVREGGRLVRDGIWDIARLRSEAEEFHRRFTIQAYYERGYDQGGGRLLRALHSHTERGFRKKPLWNEYEDILRETATAVATSETLGAQQHAKLPEQRAEGKEEVSWENVAISFISDERVRVKVGSQVQTYNYSEMGFEDRRNGKPNQAWGLLRTLAQSDGVISNSVRNSKEFLTLGKLIERVRRQLQAHFRIASVPIVLDAEKGYCCQFKIECAESFKM